MDEIDLSNYGSRDEIEALTHWLKDINSSLSLWALSKLAQSFEESLTQLRDRFGSINIDDTDKALEKSQILSKNFADLQRNLVPFITELDNFCDRYYADLPFNIEFQRVEERHSDHLFFAQQREWLTKLSTQLKKYEKESQRVVDRINQLIASKINSEVSKSNNRLQRGVFWMTMVLILLTIILIFADLDNIVTNISALF
ncbi:hypothetical protein ACG2F4_01790 [Halalkalibaculum sp. DA3122]|uniref:hypothetical protein n=1 Tax=Halalkalibaculum sp. DA3122 TaxID=3373607 RepID=UPI003754D389